MLGEAPSLRPSSRQLLDSSPLRPSSRQLLDTSLSGSKVANINAALQQRLGEHPRGRGHLKKLAELSQLKKLAELSSRRPSSLSQALPTPGGRRKTLFSASTVSSLPSRHQRISASISSSLPSLRHWSDSPLAAEPPSPFVPPQAPHEKLSKSSKRRISAEGGSEISSTTGEKIVYLDEDESDTNEEFEDWVDPDFLPLIMPDEPFVDDYLERIYPTSPGSPSQSEGLDSPTSSAAFLNWQLPAEAEEAGLPMLRARSASKMSQTSSMLSRAPGQQAAAQKSFRQKILSLFGTTRRAFDEFIKTSAKNTLGREVRSTLDYELTEEQFCSFLNVHFPNIEEQFHEQIFLFFDQDSGGTISLREFHRVVSAMAPIDCLAGLRCRWIALGYPSILKALELMAPRHTWATQRYDLEQFGSLLSKVGVTTWEEHVYIFGSIAKPGSANTISISEVSMALSGISTVLLLEDWRHRFLQMYESLEKAYDKIEVTPGVLTDINNFVVKANDFWKMSRHEAKRLFRLCDFDQRDKISRMKFLNTFALAEPSLLHEELRHKVRSHFKKTITKLRRIAGEKTTLDSLTPHILNAFKSRSTEFVEIRKETPDDFQTTLDEHEMTKQDTELLFELLDIKGQENLTPSAFWHVLKIFAPSCVLSDLNMQCGKLAAKTTSASREAQKMPAWQARQMGLNRTMSPDVIAWMEIAEAKDGESRAQAARRAVEADALAPMAIIGPVVRLNRPGEQQFLQRLTAPELEQVLQQSFSDSAAASYTASMLLDLLEEPMPTECKGSAPGPGMSCMELISAMGIADPDGAGEAFTLESGAKAQLQARWQYSPFVDFAAGLKDGVRQRIKQPEQPKPLPMGDSFEPVSYLRSSSLPSIEHDGASVSGVSASTIETGVNRRFEKAYDERHQCLELIRDQELRRSLSEELLAEERAKPLPFVRRQKGRKQITGPGEKAFMSMYQHLQAVPNYAPPEKLVDRLQGYYEEVGSVKEAHTSMLSKTQVHGGPTRRSGKRSSTADRQSRRGD